MTNWIKWIGDLCENYYRETATTMKRIGLDAAAWTSFVAELRSDHCAPSAGSVFLNVPHGEVEVVRLND
jgi:hypothetical protein